MLAASTYRLTDSPGVRGIALWILTALMVFWVINGLATQPHAVHLEQYREAGMSDEQALSIALQEARASENNVWWINDRTSYIVFDGDRAYDISDATFRAFGLRFTENAMHNPVAVVEQISGNVRASMGGTGRSGP